MSPGAARHRIKESAAMNNEAYDAILQSLRPLFDAAGFKPYHDPHPAKKDTAAENAGGDVFLNDAKAVSVVYDTKSSQFKLLICDVEDGKFSGEFATVAAWLFDDSHDERDAGFIGSDFDDVLRGELNMKTDHTPARGQGAGGKVAMPQKSAPDATPNMEGFTQRFLTLCPQFKEEYKLSVNQYGEFLPDDFYSRTAARYLQELLQGGSRKQLNKLMAMLGEMYASADGAVSALITGTIIAGAVLSEEPGPKPGQKILRLDKDLLSKALEYMEDVPHLRQPTTAIVKYFVKHQKEYFKKEEEGAEKKSVGKKGAALLSNQLTNQPRNPKIKK